MVLYRRLDVVVLSRVPVELGLVGEAELTFRAVVHGHLDSSVLGTRPNSEAVGFEVDVKLSSRWCGDPGFMSPLSLARGESAGGDRRASLHRTFISSPMRLHRLEVP